MIPMLVTMKRTLLKGTAALLMGPLFLLLAGPGCHLFHKEQPIYLNIHSRTYPADAFTAVKRVLILPFFNETSYERQEEVVTSAFAKECVERGCFEAVIPPETHKKKFKNLDPSGSGVISIKDLVELRAGYKVDAVLLGSVKMYSPYAPQMIGIKADLISVHNGSILRTVNGLLDVREDMVGRDLARYFENNCSYEGSVFATHLLLTSPELFASYACSRFVDAMYPDI